MFVSYCIRSASSASTAYTIIGLDPAPDGGVNEVAIGDFATLASAESVLTGIIGPFRRNDIGYCKRDMVRAHISTPHGLRHYDFATDGEYAAFLRGCVEMRDILLEFGVEAEAGVYRDGDSPLILIRPLPTAAPRGISDKRIRARLVRDAASGDADPTVVDFDVTEAVLAMPPEQRVRLIDDSAETLHLVPSDVRRRHEGPFHVEIEQALAAYFDEP